MSNDNGTNQTFWQSMLKEAMTPAFILALATLISAVTAFVYHGQQINENKQSIGTVEKKAEVAAQDADIAKDKASVVERTVEKIEKERKTDK